jgi:hypothetical protein
VVLHRTQQSAQAPRAERIYWLLHLPDALDLDVSADVAQDAFEC